MSSKHTSFNRRDFLKTSALLVGTAAIGNQNHSQTRTRGDAGETWFDKPMRWAQLVLVENDPGQYDPQFWLDYFKRTHSDAACLSAGGIVAYYPTKVPAPSSQRLDERFRSIRRISVRGAESSTCMCWQELTRTRRGRKFMTPIPTGLP